jgi:hypothetical protein
MLTSFGGLAGVKIFWKWLRRRIWQEALSAWEESTRTAKTPSIDAVHYLSEGALRTLAMQVYSRIGYGILNRDDEEGWVRMLNPVGQLELVACKQQDKPVGIGDIHELHLEVKRVEAVKGFFWAPGGFASEAMYWKGQRPIVLADRFDIGRLIDCVLAQGSNILDQ